MTRRALVVLLLAAGFFAYYHWLGPRLPVADSVVILNVLIIPGIFGVLIYLAFRRVSWLVLWAVPVALIVPLPTVLYDGGDPAKPGLHWLIYWIVVIVISLSTAVAWVVHKLVAKEQKSI